jgi:hypothetical protein
MNDFEFIKKGFENYSEIFETMSHFKNETCKIFKEAIVEHQRDFRTIWPEILKDVAPKSSRSALEEWFTVNIKNERDRHAIHLEIGISWYNKEGLHTPRLHAAGRFQKGDQVIMKFQKLSPDSKYVTYDDLHRSRITPKNGPFKLVSKEQLKTEVKELLSELLPQCELG